MSDSRDSRIGGGGEKRSGATFSQALSALDSITDAVVIVDRRGRLAYANRSAEGLFGRGRDDLVGRDIHEAYPRPSTSLFYRHLNLAMTESRAARFKEPLKMFGRRLEVSIEPSKDGVAICFHDVTQEAFIEEVHLLALLMTDKLKDMAFMVRPDGRIFYANKEAGRLLGYGHDDLLRMGILDLDRHFGEGAFMAKWHEARRYGSTSYESKYVAKDGREIPVDVSISYLRYYGEEYCCVAARDITQYKDTEARLRDARIQAELYLDLMGHDINNLNQISLGCLELALDGVRADAASIKLVSTAVEALNNSTRIISNIKKIRDIKEGSVKYHAVDVGELLGALAAQYANVGGRCVAIDYRPEGECRVLANAMLNEVLANLIGNAIKHSAGPLAIRLRTERQDGVGKDHVKVIVEDDGPGIPDEMKENIFNRLYRGPTRAQGSGLGLYLTRMLVEGYRGKIWVEDRVPGDHTKGARFVVLLPTAK